MESSHRISIILASLRFPLICLVIFIHIIPDHIYPVLSKTGEFSLYYFVSELFSHVLGGVAVPTFYLISGYFSFSKGKDWLNPTCYTVEIQKKIRSLLFPYLFWNILFILVVFLRDTIVTKSFAPLLSYSLEQLFNDLWIGPINYPLWFLRDLIVINLLLPLLLLLLKHLKFWFVLGLSFLYICGFDTHFHGLSLTTLLYFSTGACLAFFKVDFLDIIQRFKVLFLSLFSLGIVLLPMINQSSYYFELHRCFIPIGVSVFILVAKYTYDNKNKISSHLVSWSSMVFFIYATHALLIINWVKGFLLRLGFHNLTDINLPLNALVTYTSVGILTLTVCILGYLLGQRIAPKFLLIITGGRA